MHSRATGVPTPTSASRRTSKSNSRRKPRRSPSSGNASTALRSSWPTSRRNATNSRPRLSASAGSRSASTKPSGSESDSTRSRRSSPRRRRRSGRLPRRPTNSSRSSVTRRTSTTRSRNCGPVCRTPRRRSSSYNSRNERLQEESDDTAAPNDLSALIQHEAVQAAVDVARPTGEPISTRSTRTSSSVESKLQNSRVGESIVENVV